MHAGDKHLQELFRRCKTAHDIKLALRIAQTEWRTRGQRAQYNELNAHTTQILLAVRTIQC